LSNINFGTHAATYAYPPTRCCVEAREVCERDHEKSINEADRRTHAGYTPSGYIPSGDSPASTCTHVIRRRFREKVSNIFVYF